MRKAIYRRSPKEGCQKGLTLSPIRENPGHPWLRWAVELRVALLRHPFVLFVVKNGCWEPPLAAFAVLRSLFLVNPARSRCAESVAAGFRFSGFAFSAFLLPCTPAISLSCSGA